MTIRIYYGTVMEPYFDKQEGDDVAVRKFLVGDHTYGPLAIEEPLSVSAKRRFHISDDVDFLSNKDPRGPKLMTVVRRVAAATGVRLISVQGHRFDVVPADPDDLSPKMVVDFGRRLRANEAQLLAAVTNKR